MPLRMAEDGSLVQGWIPDSSVLNDRAHPSSARPPVADHLLPAFSDGYDVYEPHQSGVSGRDIPPLQPTSLPADPMLVLPMIRMYRAR